MRTNNSLNFFFSTTNFQLLKSSKVQLKNIRSISKWEINSAADSPFTKSTRIFAFVSFFFLFCFDGLHAVSTYSCDIPCTEKIHQQLRVGLFSRLTFSRRSIFSMCLSLILYMPTVNQFFAGVVPKTGYTMT